MFLRSVRFVCLFGGVGIAECKGGGVDKLPD